MIRICKICGKEYSTYGSRKMSCCSNQCRFVFMREQNLKRPYPEKKCLTCGKKLSPKLKSGYLRSRKEFAKRKFCSLGCANSHPSIKKARSIANSGKNNPSWKGGKTVWQGYTLIKKRDHPHTTKSGYIAEHRLVMEKFLGRFLTKKENVHHINGVRSDNRIENLELRTNLKDHRGRIVCPYCEKGFSHIL